MQELEILISIQPNWIEKIAQLIKTIEVRKTCPALKPPFKCRIYCTQDQYKHLYDLRPYSNGDIVLSVTIHNEYSLVPNNYLNGKVVGEFICDKITRYNCDKDFDEYFVAGYVGAYMPLKEMCLTNKDLMEYGRGKPLYGWHISNLIIYNTPMELSSFYKRLRYDSVDGAKVVHCGHYLDAEEVDFCEFNQHGDCSLDCCPELQKLYQIKTPPQSWCYISKTKETDYEKMRRLYN